MNPPDREPLTRTGDNGLNAARQLLTDPDAVALAAILMNRGLITAYELRDMVMRAQAVP